MTVTRPSFDSPVLILDEFLEADAARICFQECVKLEPVFMPATVGNGPDNRVNPRVRRNDVVLMDRVFSQDRSRSKLLSCLDRRVEEEDCKALWHEGDFIFDIINYATWKETVLSRYGTCDFYGRHQDTRRNRDYPRDITKRLVTLVYYLNSEPDRLLRHQYPAPPPKLHYSTQWRKLTKELYRRSWAD